MNELKKQYEMLLKQIGIDTTNKITNEEGKIILFNKRWILMDVEAFPDYMIKSTGNIMGERMAQEFVYWFGYSYGEKVAERYIKLGAQKEVIPSIVAAKTALFTGWGIPEILELSLERGKLLVKIYNDFESESAVLNGSKPTNNFMRGVLAGAFSKLTGSKTHAIAEFKGGFSVISVDKR
ncbi:XylR N-terminal domain-containing protein [Caldisericum exile]|nr:XylR N-terminal domain-containing protein [Caldisericum exile]